jgi:hypothetical protein
MNCPCLRLFGFEFQEPVLHATWQCCRGRQGRRVVSAFIGTAFVQNEACGSNNGSVDSLSGHQLRDSLARVKHTRLHGVLWDASDLGDLINRFLVVVD